MRALPVIVVDFGICTTHAKKDMIFDDFAILFDAAVSTQFS